MRTSTAKANGYRCPKCNDETSRDETGQGYVRHTRNADCDFEKGERDEFVPPEPVVWHTTQNRDNGSLRTGEIRVEVGDTIEIRGEGKQRRVTYVMGSQGNCHATFKGQGAVPEGKVEWRVVARAGNGVAPVPEPPAPPPAPVPAPKDGRLHTLKLVLEILAVLITVIGGIIGLIWKFK